jgi:peptidoglycan/LPS O-acetylase OafA/YrhL
MHYNESSTAANEVRCELSMTATRRDYLSFLDQFRGAAIADAYIKGEPLPFVRSSLWLWLALFIAADLIKPLHEFSFTFAALVTAIAIARLLSRDAQDANEAPSVLPRSLVEHVRLAGVCSYSIYLIHLPIVEVWPQVVRFIAPAAGPYPSLVYVGCLASWALTLPLSWVMYRYVELPAIAMGKRVIQSQFQTS